MPTHLIATYRYLCLIAAFVGLCVVPSTAQTFTPGVPVFDSTQYVEYIPGDLPVVISVPHGGYLEPMSIPIRDCVGCVYLRDSFTQELGRSVVDAIFQKTGCYPHVIINLLHRNRFDANRSITTAADSNATVEQAWYAYHEFIDTAKAQVLAKYGKGLFLDLHGHGHTIQRIELGYLLSRTELQLPDSVLNTLPYVDMSSIETLAGSNLQAFDHAQLLRGPLSFGSLLENKGVPAVPSTSDPFPMGMQSYFSGGYNTARHGSENGGDIDGIQIECHQDVRFDSLIREDFADSLALTINDYIDHHYVVGYANDYCNITTGLDQELELEELVLYPNPASTHFNLEGTTGALDVTIFNGVGQRAFQGTWQGRPINISALPPGHYAVFLREEERLLGTKQLIRY